MRTRRFINRLLIGMALLLAPLALLAAEPYSVTLTHHSAGTGDSYKVRFTIEGASGIQHAGQGMGSDGGILEGYADPNGTITVTMEWVECSDPSGDLQYKRIDVWMGNRGTNGDAMRDDEQQFAKYAKSYGDELDRVVYTFKCSDFKLADPSVSDSTLMVNASGTVQLGSTQTETIIYLKLKLGGAPEEGAHVTVDNEASKDDGSTNYVIPSVLGAILTAGGLAAYRRKKKKQKEGRKKNKQQERDDKDDEDDEEDDDQLEMEIYKNCGDTLVAGDMAEQISACIIRKPKNGPEYVDEALTRQIEITSDDGYLEMSDLGMVNGWRSAYARAPESDNPPQEGIVIFRLATADGSASYTNRLHFNIRQGGIVFGQDNLTMPAMYKEKVRLPFLISGVEKEGLAEPPVIKIFGKERDEATDYQAVAEWDPKEELYEAVISDLWQDEQQLETLQPGDFLTYYLDVEATAKSGLKVKGRLPLYRFYMGLALKMDSNDVGCYFEEYDPVHHSIPGNYIVKEGDKQLTPAHTRVWLKVYDWDPETHRIFTIDPALKEDAQLKVVAFSERQQEEVDQLGLQLTGMETQDGKPYFVLRCRLGVLNAPNRINVQLQMKGTVGDQELTFRRNVRLLSQKKPTLSPAALVAWQDKQNRILANLDRIENEIFVTGMTDRLSPLVLYMRLQVDAFLSDNTFGFDQRNINSILNTYQHFLEGQQAEANSHTLVACDNLEEVTWEYFKAMRTTVKDMGFCANLFASVATFGLFDVAVATIEVVGVMKDYVDKGGDSVFGMFCVGAWQVTKKYLWEKGFQLGLKTVTNYVKTGGDVKGTWNLTKADAKEMLAKEFDSVRNFARKSNAAKQAEALDEAANKEAADLGHQNKYQKGPHDDKLIAEGRKRAQENLDELQQSLDALKKNPSEANVIRRNAAIVKCQQDKQTMMMLKGQKNWETVDICNRGVNFGECRAALNKHLDTVYKATDNRVKHQLAKLKPGLKPDDIKVLNATSSDKAKLLSGKTVTFDRDITYYYIDKTTGKTQYFSQSVTERFYAKQFHEVAYQGTQLSRKTVDALDQVSKEFAKKMDQTVVEDVLFHPESYGIDLPRMIKSAFQGDKLKDPKKVAEAVFYKGRERQYIFEELMKKAKNMSGEEALDMQCTAVGELLEGFRQQVKVFDLLNARDIQRAAENGGSMISGSLRKGIAILRKAAVDGSTNLNQAENSLKAINLSFDKILNEMYETVHKIG